MTVHSLEFTTDYDHMVYAGCTGCRWETTIYGEAREAHYEFAGHLSETFHALPAEVPS